jgi:hypothetical protein
LSQDYPGQLTIVLLLKNATDSSLPHLRAAWPLAESEGNQLLLLEAPHRKLLVYFTGVDAKNQKINLLTSMFDSPYMAILDADHQARPDWIRSSVALLELKKGRFIQARREPVSARGLFGLWDSLHQHIGCEVLNIVFRSLDLTVFFTGTTAVMQRSLLKEFPLSDCLTEDTDLSYQLILSGEKILYNPLSGSEEEVSPDLYSFLARRRRWAHGHSQAFLRQFMGLWTSKIGLREKLQLVIHGLHYLIVVPVFLVHGLLAALVAKQLPAGGFWLSMVGGAVLAGFLNRAQKQNMIASWLVLCGWFCPGLILLAGLMVEALPGEMLVLSAIGLSGPLLLLLCGLFRFKQLGLGSGLVVVFSYPLAFYLDCAGVLLGLADLLLGQSTWLVVARKPTSHRTNIRESWRTRSLIAGFWNKAGSMKFLKWGGLIGGLVGFGVLGNSWWHRVFMEAVLCTVMQHDDYPWIMAPEKVMDYCGGEGRRTGGFSIEQQSSAFEAPFWKKLDTTFPCNNAVFQPANVEFKNGATVLNLKEEAVGGKNYSAGSAATVSDQFLYGRFEVELKPAKSSGVLTAFFLYRFDPWQEIDLEFLGKDTTKLLINVFYNPGDTGALYNYGYRGTPVLVDLGFDAASAFHRYAVEWDPKELRWFVDGKLVHVRPAGKPTPIPHLPMRVHINVWPICSEELAGPLGSLPVQAEIKEVVISRWVPPLFFKAQGWLDQAGWM